MEQFERIRRDRRVEGLSIRALAKRHKVHRRTVREALASATPPARKTPERERPVFGPYEPIVQESLSRVVDEKSHSGGDGPVFGVSAGCCDRRRVTPLL